MYLNTARNQFKISGLKASSSLSPLKADVTAQYILDPLSDSSPLMLQAIISMSV